MVDQDNSAGNAAHRDQTMPPDARLHSNRDYSRVFHRQQKAAGRWVVVLVTPRSRKGSQLARLGVMISAKAVKTAVRRHALKRWTRELFRTRLKDQLTGHDCVVLFRTDVPAGDEHRRRFDEEVAHLVRKALSATAQPGQRGGRRSSSGAPRDRRPPAPALSQPPP